MSILSIRSCHITKPRLRDVAFLIVLRLQVCLSCLVICIVLEINIKQVMIRVGDIVKLTSHSQLVRIQRSSRRNGTRMPMSLLISFLVPNRWLSHAYELLKLAIFNHSRRVVRCFSNLLSLSLLSLMINHSLLTSTHLMALLFFNCVSWFISRGILV